MKIVYKSEIDGQIFENQQDCLKHDFELKGGKNDFKKIIDEAFDILRKHSNLLEIKNLEYNAYIGLDDNPNISNNYLEYQKLKFDVYFNGKKIDETYDTLQAHEGFSVQQIVQSVLVEYIYPLCKEFVGILKEINQNEDNYYEGIQFSIGDIELKSLLVKLVGKKVRLIIED